MRKIYFRADASANIGYGHFIRTLALADMLKDDFDCTFYTISPTAYQVGEMEKVCKFVALKPKKPLDDFLELLQGDEIVVLDNYFYTTEYQQLVKDKGCKLVVMDDLHLQHNVADVLINHGNINSEAFDVEPYTRVCLGLDWALLRKPFLESNKNLQKKQQITICFGGSDQLDITSKAIAQCLEKYPTYQIVAVVGDKYVPSAGFVEHESVTYRSKLSADEMASLFSESEYVICSASTVSIEALTCGAKVAAGWYVDNQEDYYHNLVGLGHFIPLGYIAESFNLPDLSNIPTKQRSAQLDVANNYKCMFEQLSNGLYLRPARESDKDILFKWANDPLTRENSFNSTPIEYSNHCAWFERMMHNDSVLMYVLVLNGGLAGNVRLNIEEENAEIGYSIAPTHRGKGLANKIIDLITKETIANPLINKLIAQVKESSIPSRLIFEKDGFVIDEEMTKTNLEG